MENSNARFLAADLDNKRLRGNRSSKKERHRKIDTARGPRDPRMRLSLDVAKRFFKLQDMLGFDKASNTIKWLVMNSKHAIQDLQCEEVLSGINDQMIKKKFNSCTSNKEIKKRRIVCIDHSLAKEARKKARASARKRATEKRSIKLGCDQNTNPLEPWVRFGELSDQTEYLNSHLQLNQLIVGDDSSMMASNWNPSFLFYNFNYQHNVGPCHEHQFSDLQIFGNPWEDFNN